MMSVLRAEDPEIVQWLHGNMPAGVDEQDIDRVIRFSLRGGDDKIAKTLMPKGRCVLDYASCRSVEMVEVLLDCAYIQRDRSLAHPAIQNLARLGRLDLMQRIVLLRSPTFEDSELHLNVWWNAITTACEDGYLELLQWLLDHPLGQDLRATWKQDFKHYRLVCSAGQNDQVEIMQYL
ncbi:hypothetical protein JG687_00011948 [Phytophthora cactorum]|nr:hypothetical protein Pcac1_g13054 [Phytophthora cactorum]KAG2865436.1 hypothetical protein PC113_g3713 [Phytophthora cactorum]KAG3086641.1 hypothetical protein PC121_g4819 [Phytophthora cactorum]KAG6954182.1 hypothetical protein JG687_00011948 [Phytophthora cactorum]RAW37652.1 hypothetical protein PC110_g6099 [Phytophthora cactorum]